MNTYDEVRRGCHFQHFLVFLVVVHCGIPSFSQDHFLKYLKKNLVDKDLFLNEDVEHVEILFHDSDENTVRVEVTVEATGEVRMKVAAGLSIDQNTIIGRWHQFFVWRPSRRVSPSSTAAMTCL